MTALNLHRRMTRLLTLIVVVIGVLAACQAPLEIQAPPVCPGSVEFGFTGCFEISGEVVDATGQPLGGISVGVHPVSDPGAQFSTAYQFTDVTGTLLIREARFLGRPSANGSPDTVTVYVVAADPRSAGVSASASIQDSVLTVVTVAPPGDIPTTSAVRIILHGE
jgi:hypothetical protein